MRAKFILPRGPSISILPETPYCASLLALLDRFATGCVSCRSSILARGCLFHRRQHKALARKVGATSQGGGTLPQMDFRLWRRAGVLPTFCARRTLSLQAGRRAGLALAFNGIGDSGREYNRGRLL